MRVCALAGGVGGAKLAAGLQEALSPGELTVVVNTADDFDLWSLRICPDLDTVMYTLVGIANPETGWGIRDETFSALGMLSRYGEETWFRVGDRDLATNVLRTRLLREGERLTEVALRLSGSLGVPGRLLPMCDEPVSTVLHTPAGTLEFQEYFVRRGQRDEVLGVELRGIRESRMTGEVEETLFSTEAVVLCPSNPVVSIGPILAVPGMRRVLAETSVPCVAVSPIVGGRALKGPADRMMASLGREPSAAGVAREYKGIVDGMVIDHADEQEREEIEALGMRVLVTDAVMRSEPDRTRLAREVLGFCEELRQA
jgi:LPPG:FO 2-phospho-L-lactate transferase